MKLHHQGETIEVGVSSALAGRRCDSIELNWRDVEQLMKMPPNVLHAWLCNSIATKFSIDATKYRREIQQ